MNNRKITYLAILNGAIFVYAIISIFFISQRPRTFQSDIIQGLLLGFALAFVTAQIAARVKSTNVNGWVTMVGCALPGNGVLMRAASAQLFPGPINVPREAMYWIASIDDSRRALSGAHDYRIHFGPGQLPPANAFWSLTMGDAKNRFVPNPIHRYSLSDHSGLASNSDGSIDIYIQHGSPEGHESNWLPAPSGSFILWLRAYQPGEAILNGSYRVPPVMRVR